MEEKTITRFSIEELRQRRPNARGIYDKGCFISETYNSDEITDMGFGEYPCRINAFFISILREGEGSISVNLNEHKVKGPSLFINTPSNILKFSVPQKSRGCIIGFEEAFANELSLNLNIKGMLPLFLEIQKNPVLEINHEECDELVHIVHELGREMSRPEKGFLHKEIIQCYFSLLLVRIGEIVHTRLNSKVETTTSAKSRNEEYFSRFMEELGKHYQEERSVGFYASKLCITPKYLTTIIKRVSGRSAAEWIDSYVILEAKNLLRYSNLSIQEVAYQLNFPNQSFFGKYFKHQTGYSPSAYKMLK